MLKPTMITLGLIVVMARSANAGSQLVTGHAKNTITIQEFSDFECPYCILGSHLMKDVLKNYPDKITFIFRNLPLTGHVGHEHSLAAAKAMSAINLQSSLLADLFQKELFAHQTRLSEEGDAFIYELAEKLGVNVSQMKIDMEGDAVARSLADDKKIWDANSFTGTPTFIVGTENLRGAIPYEQLKKIIDRQLAN